MKLRKICRTDAEQIAKLMNNKKVVANLRDLIPFPYRLEDAEEFIGFCEHEDPAANFAIDLDGLLAGVIGLTIQNDIHRKTAEIGYWLGEPFWNKGIMTEAVKAIVDYGFKELDLVRIFTGVFEHNKASHRVLQKAGFKFECIFRKAIIKYGEVMDEFRYAIIRDV